MKVGINPQNLKPPFERIHHFVATPALPNNNKSPKSQKQFNKEKLDPLPPVDRHERIETASTISTESIEKDLPIVGFEYEFENFMIEVFETSLTAALENTFKKRYSALDCLLWEKSESLSAIYSQSHAIFVPDFKCLAGECLTSTPILSTKEPTKHEAYNSDHESRLVLENTPVLLFCLNNYQGESCYVVQIIGTPDSNEFTKEDITFVKFFQRKFAIFSRYLIDQPLQEPILLDMMKVDKTDNVIAKLKDVLQSYLNISTLEIWSLNKQKKHLTKYTINQTEEIDYDKLGVIGNMIKSEKYVNTESVDDPLDIHNIGVPTMVIPIADYRTQITLGIVIRGEKDGIPFGPESERMMKQLAPVIALSMSNALHYTGVLSDFKKSTEEREGLSALLEVAEILSRQLDIGRLCEIIMEKGRYLTKSDRCSLFLVTQGGKSLTTQFHRGLKDGIEIPINKGIVGKTVTEAKPLNILDAYADPDFNAATDIATGYRTKTILSVPIFNNRGTIIGVTEMINKKDGQAFNLWDTNLIQIFNVFCGISLENARLYNESIDMSKKLRSFFGISFSLNKTEDIKRILSDIIKNARRGLQAKRASMFIIDDNNHQILRAIIVDGAKIPPTYNVSEGIIGACVRTKKAIVTNDPKSDTRWNPKVDEITGFQTTNILAVPLISTEGEVLGVIEMINKINGNFSDDDIKLLQAFSSFAAITVENSRNKQLAPMSVRSARPMIFNDKNVDKMLLAPEQLEQMTGLQFCAFDFGDEELVRMVFTNFIAFGVVEQLRTNKETLLHFILQVRLLYNDLPYHNWRHACDVVQFTSLLLQTIDYREVFEPIEICSLLIAALCHDAGHDGFTNIFNRQVMTPIGQIFNGNNCEELFSLSQIARIINSPECNIFGNMSHQNICKFWAMMIKMIVDTDIDNTKAIVEEQMNNVDFKNANTRLKILSLFLIISNFSNVARPFDVAVRWLDALTSEFYKQGDIEKSLGMKYTDEANNRSFPDKPKYQQTFINNYALPAATQASALFAKLDIVCKSINATLDEWRKTNQ